MAAPNADDVGAQPALRPEPYMGVFRRFRVKGDDAWTMAIQWGGATVIILFALFLVLGCYFHLPSPVKAIDAGLNRFSEQRYVQQKRIQGQTKRVKILTKFVFSLLALAHMWTR